LKIRGGDFQFPCGAAPFAAKADNAYQKGITTIGVSKEQ